jgi:hypothetical protein
MTRSRSERGRSAAGRGAPPRAGREAAAIAASPLDDRVASRAALALAVSCGLLVLLRAAGAFLPGMSAWGIDGLRAAPPWAGWPLWTLAAAALIPPIARLATPALAAFGNAIARAPRRAGAALAAVAAIAVLLTPDRLWLMGDFLLRLGCARGRARADVVFPQALPLDLFLHHEAPVRLAHAWRLDPNDWERALGAGEAGALALFAVALARELGLRGVAGAACAGTLALTGLLSLFTGYGKAFVELTLLTVAAAVFALRLAREGRGAWGLAGGIVLGLLLHRSALALFAPLVAAGAWWLATGGARAHRPATIAALAVPFVAAGALAPRLLAAMRVTDLQHFAPGGTHPGMILAAALGPANLREVANLLAQVTPLTLAAPVLAVAIGPAWGPRRREALVLSALAAPALLLLVGVHPRQGTFRDADVFAPSLAALAVGTSALVGEALRGAPARAWVGVAAVLATLIPAVQLLVLLRDTNRGLERVERYATGPPLRTKDERAQLWAFVAQRRLALGQSDAAAAAFEHAAVLAPSPSILMEWALTEERRGAWARARAIYADVAARMPTLTDAWLGVGRNAFRLRDRAGARAAAARAMALEPERIDVIALAHVAADTAAGRGWR